MPAKTNTKQNTEKNSGFSLEKLFDEVSRVSEKAKEGDKSSKQILNSASEKWGESENYVL